MKKLKLLCVFNVVIVSLFFSIGVSANAEDGSSQVSRKSSINFLEEKVAVEKPKTSGILPQTGEIIIQYLPCICLVAVIFFLMILLVKRRKKYEE